MVGNVQLGDPALHRACRGKGKETCTAQGIGVGGSACIYLGKEGDGAAGYGWQLLVTRGGESWVRSHH